ncbi:nucleoside diphosphate kinase regulator [Stieleria sp. TO1_6]|uniref:nucleoside diphosphate kinase regulator n=1 Tax=Stieleria tagensis TaxID=2956795 RepID=UPI00209B17B5|nr:nucleoside diphosphate kinase regulator [Stieleria tagensis]MCO8120893.1 nucleoside diphosphate kinase regulator [Stieleria tagensis]
MARKQIIITKADHERLEQLFLSRVAGAFRNKPYLNGLRGELDIAQIVDPSEVPCDVITMNSTVRLRDIKEKETETFTLVYPDEANIAEGKLSILAPLGTAILGYRVGDLVQWQVPTGMGRWRVEELLFQPERDRVAA